MPKFSPWEKTLEDVGANLLALRAERLPLEPGGPKRQCVFCCWLERVNNPGISPISPIFVWYTMKLSNA